MDVSRRYRSARRESDRRNLYVRHVYLEACLFSYRCNLRVAQCGLPIERERFEDREEKIVRKQCEFAFLPAVG